MVSPRAVTPPGPGVSKFSVSLMSFFKNGFIEIIFTTIKSLAFEGTVQWLLIFPSYAKII